MRMNDRIPVEVIGNYVICFEAITETTDMESHFIDECGWTEEEYEGIADSAWFIAEVTVWEQGECLASEHLGCCCYNTIEDFIGKYRGDYYTDMKNTLMDHVIRNAA